MRNPPAKAAATMVGSAPAEARTAQAPAVVARCPPGLTRTNLSANAGKLAEEQSARKRGRHHLDDAAVPDVAGIVDLLQRRHRVTQLVDVDVEGEL